MTKAKARPNPASRWTPALVGSVLLLAACSTPSPAPGSGGGTGGPDGGSAAGGGAGTGCVDNVLCVQGFHWDSSACKCVPTVPSCSGDADCHGPLPQLCQLCADGSTGCAHYECITGKCAVVTCSGELAR